MYFLIPLSHLTCTIHSLSEEMSLNTLMVFDWDEGICARCVCGNQMDKHPE